MGSPKSWLNNNNYQSLFVVVQGVNVGEEPLLVLFSATSALPGSQRLTDNCDKTLPFIQNVTFGMSGDIIVMSQHLTLSSQQDMMMSYDITIVMVFHRDHSNLSYSDRCWRPMVINKSQQ